VGFVLLAAHCASDVALALLLADASGEVVWDDCVVCCAACFPAAQGSLPVWLVALALADDPLGVTCDVAETLGDVWAKAGEAAKAAMTSHERTCFMLSS